MIRRGFWLTAGVVLGVTGYRRLTRLATALTGPPTPGLKSLPGTGGTAGPQMLAPPARRKSTAGRVIAAAKFVRDVRDGMAEYREMHRDEPTAAQPGRTLERQVAEPAGSGAAREQSGRRP